MKTYTHGVKIDEYANFILEMEGNYLNRLIGVAVDKDPRTGNIVTHAVYQPLLHLERHPGQVVLDIFITLEHCLGISLSERYPWISARLFNTKVVYSEDE